MVKRMWEVLVPTNYRDGLFITLDTHRTWDRSIISHVV